MKFFNKKEQVLDIQLTQYGKFLLAEGQFEPQFYSFFDDEIIYDLEFADHCKEYQNSTETRIKENINIETQYIFSGVETNIKNVNKLIRANKDKEIKIQRVADKHYSTISEIGTSENDNEYATAFKLSTLIGQISSSIYYKLNDSHPLMKIPQIESEISFETSISYTFKKDSLEQENDSINNSKIFDDKSFISVKDDFILISLEEINSKFEEENFDIEVYEIEDLDTTQTIFSGSGENLVPLYFTKKKQYERFILQEQELKSEISNLNTNYVEYYIDILTDGEIDSDIFCEIKKDKKKSMFTDSLLECPEKDAPKNKNVYESEFDRNIYKTDLSSYEEEKEEC